MAWTTAKWRAVILDFLERAGWSAGEVFVATLLAGGAKPVTGLPWKYAITLALSAAVSSLLLTLVQYLTRATNLPFAWDLLVRLAKTFVGSLLASVAAAGIFNVTKFDWATALSVAVVATLGALGKGLLARGPQPVVTAGGGSAGQAAATPNAPNPSTLGTATYNEAVRDAPTPTTTPPVTAPPVTAPPVSAPSAATQPATALPDTAPPADAPADVAPPASGAATSVADSPGPAA